MPQFIQHKLFALLLVLVYTSILQSCQNDSPKHQVDRGLILHDSLISDNFIYNEKTLKWERNTLQKKKRDSITAKIEEFNHLGSLLRDKSQYKNALTIHFQALQLAEEIGDTTGIIYAYNNIGTDLRRTASPVEASEYHYRALEMAGLNPKRQKCKAIAMNGLGNVFLELQNPEEAKSYFEKSLGIEKNLNSGLGKAINYANLGDVMRMQGDDLKALNYYNLSLKENLIIGSGTGVAICKNAIGTLYLEKNNPKLAVDLIKESVDIINTTDDAYHKMEMEVSLCRALIALRRLPEAEKVLDKVFSIVETMDSYENKQTAYELQTLLRKEQRDYEGAFMAKEKALTNRDSIMNQNNEVRILELENRYKNKQAIQQIKFLLNEKKLIENSKINQQRFFFALFIMMLSVIGFVYSLYRNRRKVSMEWEKVNEIKSRFFGNVSHEFRTPLTLIKGPLEKLLHQDIPDTIRVDAEMMHRNTERLLSLVNQILSLSKIDAGKYKIRAQKRNLSDDIKDISHAFYPLVSDKELHLKEQIMESEAVWFDPEIIEIILTNLLSNAIKFSPKEGQIFFKGQIIGTTYQIQITNSIANDTNQNINYFFDRFYTNMKSYQQGTGIGLSLVKELCTLYRAEISVQKNKTGQITFTLDLPIDQAHFKVEELSKIKEPKYIPIQDVSNELIAKKKDTSIIEKKVLLVIEDNHDMRVYISSIFSNTYQVLQAKDGTLGVDIAKSHIPDIIISDVMMPGMSGLELCNLLKNDIHTNHIPIILLTALSKEENIIEGLEQHADDYITKPFNSNLLIKKVANLIELRKNLANKYRDEVVIKPFNILIDKDKQLFSKMLQEVLENHLTNPQFDVEEFCELAGMSRTQLHRKLTATTGMSTTEFIRVHRVKFAAEMLKNFDISVSEICYASGFNSTSYFSKHFKLFFGMTPKEYRENP